MPVNQSSRKTIEQVEKLFFTYNKLSKAKKFLLESDDTRRETRRFISLILFEAHKRNDSIIDRNNADQLYADEEKAILYLSYALGIDLSEELIEYYLGCLQWLTSIRLGGVRLNRALTVDPLASHYHTHSLTGGSYGFYSTLQLSYGLELLLCSAKLHQKAFRPQTNEDLDYKLPWYLDWPGLRRVIWPVADWYHRFDRGRLYQMASNLTFIGISTNALAWFGVNAPCYRYFPDPCKGLAILNLIAFTFDIIHDYYLKCLEIDKLQELLKEINSDNSLLLQDLQLSEHKDALVTELQSELDNLIFQRKRVTASDIGILIGMICIYTVVFPVLPIVFHFLALSLFSDPKRLKEIGIYITILAGVIFGGSGYRIYKHINKQNLVESLGMLAQNALILIAISTSFYVATTFFAVPVFALIAVASALPLIPFEKMKYDSKKAQEKEFNNFPPVNNLNEDKFSHEYTKIMKPYLTPDKPAVEQSVLNIHDFCKLRKEEQSAIRQKSGISDNLKWLSFLNNWCIPKDEEREAFSSAIIIRLLTPVASPSRRARSDKSDSSDTNLTMLYEARPSTEIAPASLRGLIASTSSELKRSASAPSLQEPAFLGEKKEVGSQGNVVSQIKRRASVSSFIIFQQPLAEIKVPNSSSNTPAPSPPPSTTHAATPSTLQRVYSLR